MLIYIHLLVCYFFDIISWSISCLVNVFFNHQIANVILHYHGARRWFADFIDWYNNSHMHSGLQYVTPAQKRSGQYISIFTERNRIINEARFAHPERWCGRMAKQYIVRAAEVLNPDKETVA